MSEAKVKIKRIESATNNMSALIDDMVKKALKNFKANGKTELDARFLKESVSALRELNSLLTECGDTGITDEAVIVRFEKQIEEWSR